MKLLLCPGHAWAASTPMFYTLGHYNKYCHTGHVKEHGYLWHMYLTDTRDIKQASFFYRNMRNQIESTGQGWNQIKLSSMPDDFPMLEFFSRPFTIKKYCEYYERVWDNVKDQYESVADFSTHLAGLSEEFLYKIKPKLLEYFDVKVIMLFRDPVKRFWSQNGANKISKLRCHDRYAENYQKYCNVFGKENVHYVIMEDFWSGEISTLSHFLDYNIQRISENVYWPLENELKKYKHLQDQWQFEKPMPTEMIPKIRELLNPLYLQYEQIVGKIPERWAV